MGAAEARQPGADLFGMRRERGVRDLTWRKYLPAGGPLHDFFGTSHGTRASVVREADDTVTPLGAYDAIFYVNTLTPSPPAGKP